MWAGRDASERMISYYSYLFTFPSRGAMILVIAAISTIGCSLAFWIAWGAAYAFRGLIYGLLGLTAPILGSDALAVIIFKEDPFLTPRRVTILSYTSCIIYVAIDLLISYVIALTGSAEIFARGVYFAVAVSAFLRHLVISIFSTHGPKENLLATFTQPALCLIAGTISLPLPRLHTPFLGVLGVIITAGGAHLLLLVMKRWEGMYRGLRIIPLFRAFVLAWAEELNGPLEEQITRVGEPLDLYVDSLIFYDAAKGCRAGLIVPYIHPGPFRSVGSSALPKIIAERLSKKLGCEVLISHGVSTHERDLTSSGETEMVAEAVASDLRPEGGSDLASPVVWVERGGAQASAQLFGDVALITLTLSPKSYDDLPEELGYKIMEAASEMGMVAVVVDSHNSIQREDELSDLDMDNLYHAAVEAIYRSKKEPPHTFSVGASQVIPQEWGLDDGMGPLGVSALALRLDDRQTFVYVVLDGNNMRSGLRERIISVLRSHGVDDAEVLTSDTHLVNAIGATTRGYYPIGERIDEEKLIGHVVKAVDAAISRLERCRCVHTRTSLQGLTVLGEDGLQLLEETLTSAFSLFKKTALLVVPSSLLLAATLLFLI